MRIAVRGERWLVGAVVATSALLNAWGIAAMGWGNAYYTAAVRSMGSSWHAFAFAGLDSAGYVSVDKPPLSLWVQVLSTRLFGFHPLAILLPEVLAGALAVWLLWWGVRRTWGRTAAVVAAAALALTPINVVVNHSNNTDAVLVLLMTAAAVGTMEAVRTGRLRWLLGATALAGLAVLTKMLAAVPVMPGVFAAWVWCAPVPWRRRLGGAFAGAVVLCAVGMSWFVAVQQTAPSDRPYVGSTQTNSVFELAFERNGVGQVEGHRTAPLGGRGAERTPTAAADESVPRLAQDLPHILRRSSARTRPSVAAMGFTSGAPGPLRILDRELGGQIGWLAPLALVAIAAAIAGVGLRPSSRLGTVIVLGAWFLGGATIFSMTKGVVHPYYLSGIGPPIAGLVGIGIATFRDELGRGRRRRWFGVAGLAATLWSTWRIWRPAGWHPDLVVVPTVALASVVGAAAIFGRRRAVAVTAATAVAILVAPAMWLEGSLATGVSGPLPYAQPVPMGAGIVTANRIAPNGGFQYPSVSVPSLDRFLRAHRGNERWALAVESAAPAEEVIITSGEPVMAVGGFVGSDPILTPEQLQADVRAGEVRYFLLSGTNGVISGFLRTRNSLAWVAQKCALVPRFEWDGAQHHASEDTARPGVQSFPGGPAAAVFTMYDCGRLRGRP